MLLLLQIAVLLLAIRLVQWVAAPLRQPPVIGEMVAGILIGPSLLGRIAPSLADALFPPSSLDLLTALSQVGLALFMFTVGVRVGEYPARPDRRAAVISLTSIIVP